MSVQFRATTAGWCSLRKCLVAHSGESGRVWRPAVSTCMQRGCSRDRGTTTRLFTRLTSWYHASYLASHGGEMNSVEFGWHPWCGKRFRCATHSYVAPLVTYGMSQLSSAGHAQLVRVPPCRKRPRSRIRDLFFRVLTTISARNASRVTRE